MHIINNNELVIINSLFLYIYVSKHFSFDECVFKYCFAEIEGTKLHKYIDHKVAVE